MVEGWANANCGVNDLWTSGTRRDAGQIEGKCCWFFQTNRYHDTVEWKSMELQSYRGDY